MGCGIYKIFNKINGKTYIGSSLNLQNRKYKHFWMLSSNSHDNQYLQNSFNKYGEEFFGFEIIEECNKNQLIDRENFYILQYKSNDLNYGYNLAIVNEFRRNTYNLEVKISLSKYNLIKNNNFSKFSFTNIQTGEIFIFESLVEGANYLISNGFSSGQPKHIRQKISSALRGKKINNGKLNNGSIRKTLYGHKFEIINN